MTSLRKITNSQYSRVRELGALLVKLDVITYAHLYNLNKVAHKRY